MMTKRPFLIPFSSRRLLSTRSLSAAALVTSALTLMAVASQSLAQALPPLLGGGEEPVKLAAKPDEARPRELKGFFGNNPNLVADIAEQVAPSVVNIDVEKARRVQVQDFPAFPFNEELMKRFFGFDGSNGNIQIFPPGGPGGQPPSRQHRVITGNGSGILIDSQGHILTNNHVVASADKITVTLNDKRKLPATVVGRDRFTDLAVLKIDAPNLKPAPLGNSQKLRAGEFVLAVGSPLGFDHTVTLGIVSAISRRVPDINSNVDFVQTDAAINPGNSGGPLVNLRGEVVGINTAISGIGQNIGFAIPVDVAKQVANQLITHGGITRPWIGLAMTELNPELAKSLGLPENQQGVVVSQVMPNSPSAKAGFKQGDIIQRIDGQKVDTPKTVQEWVQKKPVQSKLNMQILRDGQLMALSVTTDQLPDRDLGSAPARQRPEPPMTPGPGAIPFFGGEDDTP